MKKIFILGVLCSVVAGCAGNEKILPERSVYEIYESAYSEFNNHNYDVAAE